MLPLQLICYLFLERKMSHYGGYLMGTEHRIEGLNGIK